MSDYRTDEEVRNYDIFKGVILVLLLVSLFLSVMLGGAGVGDSTAPYPDSAEVVEEGAIAGDEIAEAPVASEISAPELLSPAPDSQFEPGLETFSGMGFPDSQVVLLANGTPLGLTHVDENGTWEVEVELPADLEYIQLQALDDNGNIVAVSNEIPMTINQDAQQEEPVEEETAGQESEADEPAGTVPTSVNLPEESTYEGQVTLSGAGQPGTTLRVLANGQDIGTAVVAEDGTWTFDVELPAGEFSIDVETLDEAGNVIESVPGITLAVLEPQAPSVEPSELPVPQFNPLTGSLALEGASAPGARVAAIIDDEIIDDVAADSEGRWQINLNVVPGAYALAFGLLDEDGNITSSSEPVDINVPRRLPQLDLPDFSLPDDVLAAISGQEAAAEGDSDQAAAEVSDEGAVEAAEEGDAGPVSAAKDILDNIELPDIQLPAGPLDLAGTAEPGDEVAVVVDGQITGTATADEEGNFTLSGNLAEGVRSLQLGILGEDGALVALSKEITVAVADIELPTVQLPALTGDEETVALSGTAEPGATVEITADGETVGETTADAGGAWSFDLAPLAAAVSLRVQAIGEDGLPILRSSPVQLPGSGEAVAEAPAESEAETPPEGQESETPAEGEETAATDEAETETPAEGEETAAADEAETETPAEDEAISNVSGTVTYLEDIPLPDDAVVLVQIQDISRADAVAVVLGEQFIEPGGQQVPIAYEVAYNADEIDERFTYSMRARIEDSDGNLLFTNDSAIPVITRDNPTEEVEILTVQIRSAESDAELGQSDVTLEEEADSAVEATEASGSFSILLDGLQAAGLTQTLADIDGEYTLFAPTDEAFEALPPGILAGWNANPEEYANIMRYLVVEGSYPPEALTDGLVLRSVVETNIGITRDEEMIYVGGVPVIDAVEAGGSIVYALPHFILPPLPAGISAPIIDESGVAYFIGDVLTVVGRAEPGQRIVLGVDDERFGDIATVDANGFWLVSGDIEQGIHYIVGYMIDDKGLLRAVSQEVVLAVP